MVAQQRQADLYDFETNLVYKLSSRPARVTFEASLEFMRSLFKKNRLLSRCHHMDDRVNFVLFWEGCQPIFQCFGSHHQWFWFWFISPERKSRKDGLISFLGAAAIKHLEISGSFLFTTLGSLLYRSWMLICNTLNKFPSFVFSKGL